ncbi:general substrate transporter [Talaromyces proteolyticus]|uniref:General substrate transporter n=1 Tax=Talaromyces proteolyticus TaxID=1131652 RepID=A0AAD4L3R2_9EURO|nr:general substrate transporter [Talaromyces proteolyticus]KAH8706026.1 general substrate transporter [Talaromyces proteolyticus]
MSDSLGRTRTLAIGALVFALGAAIEASASQLSVLIIDRLIVGAGEGLFLSTLVVYICEISPAKYRGPLASMVQLFITIGLMVGYFLCYGTTKTPSSFSWRFPFAFQAGLSFLLAVAAFFYLPESPRWLAHKGKLSQAASAWVALEVASADQGDDVLDELHHRERPQPNPPTGTTQRIRNYFQGVILNLRRVIAPSSRKQVFLAVFLMSMQQLSGIDAVLYYAPLLFQQAGLSSSQASFFASGVSAILICLTSIPALLMTDKIGRRASTLYGRLLLAVILTIIGSLYASKAVHQSSGPGPWVVIVCIYLFSITYCITWAFGIKVFASEIQPAPTRATVTSIAQSANFVYYKLCRGLDHPILLQKSSFAIYFLFCGCIIVTIAVGALFMPETKGRPLENIGDSFAQNHQNMSKLLKSIRLGSQFSRM